MSLAHVDTTVTPEEYLEGELLTDIRHEYLGGNIYAMGGASDSHNVISLNIATALRQHLRGHRCRAYINDMKVRVPIREDVYFYYPDVFVTCQKETASPYYKEHPVIIFEVLSPSTDRVDRREKFLAYERIPAFQTYVLLEQSSVRIEISRRTTGDWEHDTLISLDDVLQLAQIDCDLPVSQIYEDVDGLLASV